MTNLLIVCKDCRHEVWMTPREYIKWRCPLCNGYPAVRESRRDKATGFNDGQQLELSNGICGSLDASSTAAVKQAVCSTAS